MVFLTGTFLKTSSKFGWASRQLSYNELRTLAVKDSSVFNSCGGCWDGQGGRDGGEHSLQLFKLQLVAGPRQSQPQAKSVRGRSLLLV